MKGIEIDLVPLLYLPQWMLWESCTGVKHNFSSYVPNICEYVFYVFVTCSPDRSHLSDFEVFKTF